MSGVTDAVFRRMMAQRGKPDVMFTEFVSADGLCSSGRERLLPDLWFDDAERPIVAQLFGGDPESMARAAELVARLGFDGIDINAGCPHRTIEKQGGGAALLKDLPSLAGLVHAARKGSGLPVSVKTRLGYQDHDILDWLDELLAMGPAAISLHARSRQELSRPPAHWEIVAEVVDRLRKLASPVPLVGNGDIKTLAEAREQAARSDVDGVMVGRAVYGNPWFFAGPDARESHPPAERLATLLEHARLYEDLYGPERNFAAIKKHVKGYVSGLDAAKELRHHLMLANSADEMAAVIDDHLATMPRD